MTNKKSFDNIEKWRNELRKHVTEETPIFLRGNKIDLAKSRAISFEDGLLGAEGYSSFNELSAKEGTAIPELFESLAYEIISNKFSI